MVDTPTNESLDRPRQPYENQAMTSKHSANSTPFTEPTCDGHRTNHQNLVNHASPQTGAEIVYSMNPTNEPFSTRRVGVDVASILEAHDEQ